MFGLFEIGESGVHRAHRVHHVGFESLLPGFLVVLHGERRDIGYENVDPAERGGAVADKTLERGLVRNVDGGAEGLDALGL